MGDQNYLRGFTIFISAGCEITGSINMIENIN